MSVPRTANCKILLALPSHYLIANQSVVPISYKDHVSGTCKLRNFNVRQEPALNLTITEALLATLATPPLFAPTSIFKDAATFKYIGGDLSLSNPTRELISEAHSAFGSDERVACLLSLGCGHLGLIDVPKNPDLTSWNRLLENMVMNNQQRAQEIESQMGHLGIYHRYSVTRGLERSNSTTDPEPGEVLAHTGVYLADVAVSRNLDLCAKLLEVRDGGASLEQLSESLKLN